MQTTTKTRPQWAHKVHETVRTMAYFLNGFTLFAHPGDNVLLYGSNEDGTRFLNGVIFRIDEKDGEPVFVTATADGKERRLSISDIHWYMPEGKPTLVRPLECLMGTMTKTDKLVSREQLTPSDP